MELNDYVMYVLAVDRLAEMRAKAAHRSLAGAAAPRSWKPWTVAGQALIRLGHRLLSARRVRGSVTESGAVDVGRASSHG